MELRAAGELIGTCGFDYVRMNIFGPNGMIYTGAYELDASAPNPARS